MVLGAFGVGLEWSHHHEVSRCLPCLSVYKVQPDHFDGDRRSHAQSLGHGLPGMLA